MAANRRRDTAPELQLRSALHGRGHRFRVDFPIPVSGRRPIRLDIAFTRLRVAIFVDGCFWHGCPEHGSMPKTNQSYWAPKIARNRKRDLEVEKLLAGGGWTVIRIWEHEAADEAALKVERRLSAMQ